MVIALERLKLDPKDDNFMSQYGRALNRIDEHFEDLCIRSKLSPEEVGKDQVMQWIKDNSPEHSTINAAPIYEFLHIGKIAWLLNNQYELRPDNLVFFTTKIKTLAEKYKPEDQAPVQVRTDLSHHALYYRAYNVIEDYIDDGKSEIDPNFALEIINSFKSKKDILAMLHSHFQTCLDELVAARSPELSEYFEGVPDKNLEVRKRAYIRIIDTLQNVQENRRVSRKNKKKTVRVEKKVKKVNYKTSDANLQITSIDPANIVGSRQIVAFNTKTRKAIVWVAEAGKVLDVKGTTIQNFDELESYAKTLRKPPEQLKHLRGAGNLNRVKVLLKDTIRGKLHSVNGRINKDILILKVFNET